MILFAPREIMFCLVMPEWLIIYFNKQSFIDITACHSYSEVHNLVSIVEENCSAAGYIDSSLCTVI
jgi:hypothetical protein